MFHSRPRGVARVTLALTLTVALLGAGPCDKKAPPPRPDYLITQDAPNELKTSVAGGLFNRPVRVMRAGLIAPPFPANVTLGVVPPGGGIAAAYTNAAAGAAPFTSNLQITVPGGIAPGRYPIDVTGTAPPIADKRET